jgi:hypothetical protein
MKTTKLTLMLMAVLLLTACAQSSRLKSIVESENATCPYELEEDVTVNSVELTDENTVTYYIELANHFDYLIDDEESKEILHDGLLHWFTDGDSPFDEVVNAVINEEGYISCEVQNSKGDSWNCEFSAYKLKKGKEENDDIIDSDDSSDDDVDIDEMDDDTVEEMLKLGIKEADNNMPEDLGDGLTMKSIRLKDANLVYTIECDEDEVSIESLKLAKKEMKTAMVDMVKEGDDDIIFICKALVRTNRGMDYKYVGDVSRESLTIHLTTQDLKRALGL